MNIQTGQIRYPFPDPPSGAETIEVAEGIFWARIPLPMALDHVNVYALDDGDGWTLIDTGVDTRKTRGVWSALLSGPLAGRPINRLIVTHHHPDHIGLAGWFQSELKAELLTTRTAWLFARMLSLDVQDTPAAETLEYWTRAGMPPDVLEKRLKERPFNFADILAPMPLGYQRIQEGDVLTAGGRRWRVRIGHGHAPEHATLWSEDGELVIAGDQLLPSISPNLGVYATEPGADPVKDWLESCGMFAKHADNRHLVLPGHKLPYYGLETRLAQLAENHVHALERLEAFLDEPRTAVECFLTIFKRPIGDAEFGLALVEAVAHCQHLWHSGRVERDLRDDGAWVYARRD